MIDCGRSPPSRWSCSSAFGARCTWSRVGDGFGDGLDDTVLPRSFPLPGPVRAEYGGPVGDRKSVVSGKSVSVRVELGGRRTIKKKKTIIPCATHCKQHIHKTINTTT